MCHLYNTCKFWDTASFSEYKFIILSWYIYMDIQWKKHCLGDMMWLPLIVRSTSKLKYKKRKGFPCVIGVSTGVDA